MLGALLGWLLLPAIALSQTPSTASAGPGRDLLETGKWEEALSALEETVKQEPGNAEALFWYGRCLEKAGLYDDALQQYRRWWSCSARDPGAFGEREGILLSLVERLRTARLLVKKVRECLADPASRGTADRMLRAASILTPSLPEAHVARGQLALLNGNPVASVNSLLAVTQTADRDPNFHGLLSLALFRASKQRPAWLERAFVEAQKALDRRNGRSDHDDAVDLHLMGAIRFNQGRFAEAAIHLKQAVEKQPDNKIFREHLEQAVGLSTP